eukprot:11838284-Alexandrium_andersonii.AAC.1
MGVSGVHVVRGIRDGGGPCPHGGGEWVASCAQLKSGEGPGASLRCPILALDQLQHVEDVAGAAPDGAEHAVPELPAHGPLPSAPRHHAVALA